MGIFLVKKLETRNLNITNIEYLFSYSKHRKIEKIAIVRKLKVFV